MEKKNLIYNLLQFILKVPKYVRQSKKLHIDVTQNDGKLLCNNKDNLSITWIGQATCLIQIDGVNILTDPVWSDSILGLRRYSKPGIKMENLPKIDIILISHAHRDHLDKKTLKKIAKEDTIIITEKTILPLLKKIPGKHIGGEYGDTISISGLNIHLLKVIHWGGISLFDRHRKVVGFMIEGKFKKIFFPGDTMYCKELKEIGDRFSPEITLMPIGDYLPQEHRKHAHISPQEAVQATLDLNTKICIPIHWGTFKLSDDDMYKPLEDLEESAKKNNTEDIFCVLKHGETYWD